MKLNAKKFLLALAWTALAARPLAATDILPAPPPFPYEGQGPFVLAPAFILSSPALQAGFIAGVLLCAPVSIAQDPRMEGRVPYDRQASIVCGRTLGMVVGWPVYAAAGLPFFLLKQIFWTGPKAAISWARKAG